METVMAFIGYFDCRSAFQRVVVRLNIAENGFRERALPFLTSYSV